MFLFLPNFFIFIVTFIFIVIFIFYFIIIFFLFDIFLSLSDGFETNLRKWLIERAYGQNFAMIAAIHQRGAAMCQRDDKRSEREKIGRETEGLRTAAGMSRHFFWGGGRGRTSPPWLLAG